MPKPAIFNDTSTDGIQIPLQLSKTLHGYYLTNLCGYPAGDRTSVWTNSWQSISEHSKINGVHTIAVRTPVGTCSIQCKNVLTYGSVLCCEIFCYCFAQDNITVTCDAMGKADSEYV